MPVREVMVYGDMPIISLIKMINANYYFRFTVVDKNLKTIFTLTESEIERISTQYGAEKNIIDYKEKIACNKP